MKTRHRRGLYSPELLESRIAPATFVVKSLLAFGPDTLQDAVTLANTTPGTDKIVFDPALTGTIKPAAEFAITEAVTIKGPGIDVITVSGDDLRRIFKIDYTVASLTPTVISGLSLIDGNTADEGGAIYSKAPLTLLGVVVAGSDAVGSGGGVCVRTTGKVVVTGSYVVKNTSANNGGGLYLRGDAGVTVSKSTISDNTATKATGGLYARVFGAKSVLLVDNCTIAQNKAGDSAGGLLFSGADDGKILLKNTVVSGNSAGDKAGGLYLAAGNLTVDKSVFAGNSAKTGGALSDTDANTVVIKNSRFLKNSATDVAGRGGGALYLKGTHAVAITGTLFSGNTSAASGGAISNQDATPLTIANCAFLGNTAASSGGAIAVLDGAVFNMKGSTLSGNGAGDSGGALAGALGAKITASKNTFSENKAADYGGAIHTLGTGGATVTLTLAGNLFAVNFAKVGGGIYASGGGAVNMKGDKVLGNVANNGNGGGLYLKSTAGITLTGLLVQGNHAFTSGGGMVIIGDATLTGLKVLGNVADFGGGLGGGIFVLSGTVVVAKSTVTGNIAATGGGIYDGGTTTIPSTKVTGNSARVDPNTHGV